MWKSKKQPTVETSVFGDKFVAMKHGMENLHGLRYKLHMMGVPLSGPSYVYGTTSPSSIIHNAWNQLLRRNQMKSAVMQFMNQLEWVKAELVLLQPLKIWLILQQKQLHPDQNEHTSSTNYCMTSTTLTSDLWSPCIYAFTGSTVPLLYKAKYNHIPNDHINMTPMNWA